MQIKMDMTIDRVWHRRGITFIRYRFSDGPLKGRTVTDKLVPASASAPTKSNGGDPSVRGHNQNQKA